MSKTHRRPDGPHATQLPLPFDGEARRGVRAGSGRRQEAVKEALRQALEGLDREEVAAELSRLTGEAVSVHALANWAAPEKRDRRLPLEYAGALAEITRDAGIMEAALPAGWRVLRPEDVAVYEYGRMTIEESYDHFWCLKP